MRPTRNGLKPRLWNKKSPYPDGAVSIMRGTPHGNPFVIGRHGDRETVIRRFECEALPLMNLEPLRGRDLLCCCWPLPCHGLPIMRKLYGDDFTPD